MNKYLTRLVFATIMCLFVASFSGQSLAADTQPADPDSAPVPTGKPWEPRWGHWPNSPGNWMKTHQGMVAQARKNTDAQIVFFGDSITQGWRAAKAWETLTNGWKTLNFGIGGDGTSQVLYRMKNGELAPVNPKVIVLCIGTNNLYGDANAGTDAEIAKGITEIVKTIQTMKPDTKILILGILPRENERYTKRIVNINEQIKNLDDGKKVFYRDDTDKFQESLGKMKADLYKKDLVHLSPAGYDLWVTLLRPELEKLMK